MSRLLSLLIAVVLLGTAGQSAPTDAVAASHSDVQTPGYAEAEATLDRLRDDPNLVYRAEEVQESESILSRLWRGVLRLLHRVFGGQAGYITRPVLGVVLGAVVLWVIVLIARSDVRILSRGSGRLGVKGQLLPDDITAMDYARLASDAEAQGDVRAALRWRFLHVLQHLNATGQSAYRPDKTHAEHAAALSPHVRAPFQLLARVFERTWYGGYDLLASAYAPARDASDAVVQTSVSRPA